MAVEFNLNVALNDKNYAKECYQKYCNGDMAISDEDIQSLQDKYKTEMDSWKPEATKDDTQYEIVDDGEVASNPIENKSSDNDKFGLRAFITGAGAGAAGFGGIIGAIVGCFASLTEALMYRAEDPNRAEHDSLMGLKEIMLNSSEELKEASEDIEVSNEAVEEAQEESEEVQETATSEIEEKQAELDKLLARQQELAGKIESGEELTDEEKAEYEELGGQIETLQGEIGEISENVTGETETLGDEVEEEQESMAVAQEKVITAREAADIAATYDEQTKQKTVNEAVLQSTNSVLGFASAAKVAFGGGVLNPTGYAAIAAGLGGGGMSIFGAAEQIKFGADISKEINIRKDIQDTVAVVQANIDEGVENIDETSETISDLGDSVPDPEEVTEQPDVPEVPDSSPEGDDTEDDDDNKNKKPGDNV